LARHHAELAILGALSRVMDKEPQAIATAAEQWALSESGGRFSDDATIVILRIGHNSRWCSGEAAEESGVEVRADHFVSYGTETALWKA